MKEQIVYSSSEQSDNNDQDESEDEEKKDDHHCCGETLSRSKQVFKIHNIFSAFLNKIFTDKWDFVKTVREFEIAEMISKKIMLNNNTVANDRMLILEEDSRKLEIKEREEAEQAEEKDVRIDQEESVEVEFQIQRI